MKQTILLSILCAGLLGGCAGLNIPDYKRPDTPAKPSWTQPPDATPSAADTISPEWWKEFRDPYLDSLIAQAIGANFDLKSLVARIDVAHAQIAEARAGALPTLDIGAGASFEKTTGQKLIKTYNLGTQVNWDIDVWGQVDKGVQAQTAEYHATAADWRAGYLKLVSDVSTTYFQILQLDEQIERQQSAVARNGQILSIFQTMHVNGLGNNTDVL